MQQSQVMIDPIRKNDEHDMIKFIEAGMFDYKLLEPMSFRA